MQENQGKDRKVEFSKVWKNTSPREFRKGDKVKLPDGRIGTVEAVGKEIIKVKVTVKREDNKSFVIEQVETFSKQKLLGITGEGKK